MWNLILRQFANYIEAHPDVIQKLIEFLVQELEKAIAANHAKAAS